MKKKNNELTISEPSAEVRDGINAENAEVSNPQTGDDKSFDAGSEKTKAEEFEALIEGKYKKQFSDKVQNIIRRRLKEVKNLDNINKEMTGKSIPEENAKHIEIIKKLIKENTLLRKDKETRLRDMEKKSLSEKIRAQAEETKEIYPGFDLAKEIRNPEFCRLVRAGVSVKNAYEVMNIDGILDEKAKNAEKKVLDSIRVKGSRPVENGSETGGGILLSSNISKLGKKERAELAKRAARGEKIEF